MKSLLILLGICAFCAITVQGDKGQFYPLTGSKNVSYYINHEYSYTWYEAFLECSYKNMTLFSAETDDQFAELFQVIASHKFVKKPHHLWIGALGANRKFVWVNSGKPVISRLWGPGNPDNSANLENCVQIFENTRHLNDIKCSEKMGFVCETKRPIAGSDDGPCDADKSTGGHKDKYRGIVFNFNQRK